jgi:hypothetical protein
MGMITHLQWKYSTLPAETAFQLSHGTSLTVFAHLKRIEAMGELSPGIDYKSRSSTSSEQQACSL